MEDDRISLKKNKSFIINTLTLVAILLIFFWIGDIILPFIVAIFISYLLNPLIIKIQKKIKNRNLAITSFILVVLLFLTGIIVLFGGHIIKDSQRFVSAVEVFTTENEAQIRTIKNKVDGFINKIYESEIVQNQTKDSEALMEEGEELDITATIKSVYSFFENPENTQKTSETKSWSSLMMIIYTLVYTVLIMYTYSYFENGYLKYFNNNIPSGNKLIDIWKDFKSVFVDYFKQRSIIVLINSLLLIVVFVLLDMPGAIIIGLIAGLLSYASHFHYLSLPLVVISCWVLSMESDTSFYIYFGIIITAYIIISILDETIYFDKIMNSVNGMNPAIMVLSFVLWVYVFGGFIGTIIALPFTQLIMIYLDKLMSYRAKGEKNIQQNKI